MKAKKVNIEFETCRAIVEKFLENQKALNWGKEIKIAKKLFSVHPDPEFWRRIGKPAHNIYTLSYFLTQEGEEFLAKEDRKKDFNPKPMETYALENNILGENIQRETKPKTTAEFLKYGQNR
jgi:hypothetical protein